jgi:hypothetical protein
MKNIFKYSSILLVSAALVQSCKSDLKSPEATAGEANFTKYIAVGNSLTAGYADGGLYLEGQKVAYPNLIAEQMKLAGLGANEFNSPFFPEDQKNGSGYVILKGFNANGSPKTANVQTQLGYDFTMKNPYTSDTNDFFLKPYSGPAYTNFGIPGIRLSNINSLIAGVLPYGFVNPFMKRLVSTTSNPAIKYIDWVSSQSATFFSLWLGNNDVLGYALSGGADPFSPITSTSEFATTYELAIAKMTAGGAKGVVATIPDVTSIAYFGAIKASTLIASVKGKLAPSLPGIPAGSTIVPVYKDAAGVVIELSAGDLITLTAKNVGVPLTAQGFPINGFGVKTPTGTFVTSYTFPLGNQEVLDVIEQSLVKSAIQSYNATIIATAADPKYNLALFDANAFLNNVKNGTIIDGTSVSAAYISGGAFSMDGVHLTPRGNAMAANGFIDAINEKYGSNIPKLQVTKYDGVKVK